MARRYGNAGNVSSLISSARSAYEKSQNLQDQIEGYNWELSAKTAEDAQKYVDYLNKRAKSYEGIDPSKQITLQQKANSANRSFVSAETGRLSNQVLEGNMSNTQKYSQLKGLYQQAVDSGDDNLAQRLYGTLDRLSMTIQNEQIAASNAAAGASDKAYAAVKKGIDTKLGTLDTATKLLDAEFKNGRVSQTEYLTKKKQLTDANKAVLQDVVQIGPDGTISSKYGLKDEHLQSYAEKFAAANSKAATKLSGLKGDEVQHGQAPFNTKVLEDGTVALQDRSAVGYKWLGGNENAPGTVAGGVYADNISSEANKKYDNAFKKLGFKGGGATGTDFTVNGQTVRLKVDNPDNPTMAYYRTPDGNLVHVLPDGRYAGVISGPNSDYSSALMQDQQKIIAKNDPAQATAASDKQIGERAAVKYTPLGQGLNSVRKLSAGRGGLGDILNAATFGAPAAGFRLAGDAMSKLSQITGLQKMVDEKRAAEAQRQAQVMEANRAQAAAQQASYQAQLAKSSVPAAPGKQLVYDWKTNTVQNKLSPVFKDPLSNNPDLRAQQVIRGGLGSNSIYNKLR